MPDRLPSSAHLIISSASFESPWLVMPAYSSVSGIALRFLGTCADLVSQCLIAIVLWAVGLAVTSLVTYPAEYYHITAGIADALLALWLRLAILLLSVR
jgi:hypothetical protein